MSQRAFIIGGTGQIGRAVADELLTNGWDVTVSHRGHRALSDDLIARGAKLAVLDREEPGALASALGSGADAVIDTIAYTANHADQLLEIEPSVGSFIVISSSSVYRDPAGRTLDEARKGEFSGLSVASQGNPAHCRPRSRNLLNTEGCAGAAPPGSYQAAGDGFYGRAPSTVHIRVHPREWWFVKRMLDGRRAIPLAYRGESHFHTSATVNIAALVRTALENPGTRILNAADPSVMTVAEIGATIAKHLDFRGEFLPVKDNSYPPMIGATPWSIPAPFTLDIGAAVALGYGPVSTYEEASKATCDWPMRTAPSNWRAAFPVLAGYSREHFDYDAEEAFLERRTSQKS